jgi:hypothetical protein
VAGGALVLIDKNSTPRKYREIAFTAKSIASRPIAVPSPTCLPAHQAYQAYQAYQAFKLSACGLLA